MATDYESLERQMKQLSRDLKVATSALHDLSIQLKDLKLGQQSDKNGATYAEPIADKQAQRTCGYVNWNTTHDILKTENWKKMSVFTDFCGKLERGEIPNFHSYIKMDDKKVVDEETRFPEDDLYVNVNDPFVRTEILYIKELRARKPAVGLVERFLGVAKDEMHTQSSFEKKYGLKWVNPLPKASNVVETEPVENISVSSVSPVENPIVTSVNSGSWCLEDTKLEEVDSDRTRSNESLSIDELVVQELSTTFTDILDQLSPLNIDYLLRQVLDFPLYDQKRMEIIADLLFEKALKTPNSSSLYATLASKLAHLKVPSENNPDCYVNFRGMIITRCQDQFESDFGKELAETNDPDVQEELQMKINERNMITSSNRAMANTKFIGELYKSKMLTFKIIDYCLRNLSDKLEEDNIECLCELLATAGKRLDREMTGNIMDKTFHDLQDIINFRSDEISSSAQFMIQDVIDLRKRKWVKGIKNVVTAFPKTLDEIQEESEKRALLIELMNTFDVGGVSVDGSVIVRRQEAVSDKHVVKNQYTVEFLKHEATSKGTQNYIKLPPKSFQNLNLFSILEKLQADPSFREDTDRDVTPTYHSSNSTDESLDFTAVRPWAQVPIVDLNMKMAVKSTIEEYLINADEDELVAEVEPLFPPFMKSKCLKKSK